MESVCYLWPISRHPVPRLGRQLNLYRPRQSSAATRLRRVNCHRFHQERHCQVACGLLDVPTDNRNPAPHAQWSMQALESVRKVYEGLQSLRSIRRIEARRRNASALSVRFSKSLASRRQRLSHARVRSTTQRMGSTTKPLAWSDRLTTSIARCGRCFATASANCGPW